MLPPLPPDSYRIAAARHSHVVSRRIVAGAIYKSIPASRSFCWWRKRRIRAEPYRVTTHDRVRIEHDIWLRSRKSEPSFRSYGDDKHDPNDRWRRKMAIWKRMIEKDPYNAIFGASNSALRGKGWQNPMWRSVAEWDKALKEMCASLDGAFEEPRADEAAAKASRTTSRKPSSDPQPSKVERGSEGQRTSSKPPFVEADPQEPIAAYRYDPISGKMVRKHESENSTATDNNHSEPEKGKIASQPEQHVQKTSTMEPAGSLGSHVTQNFKDTRPLNSNQSGLYSNLKNLPGRNVDGLSAPEDSDLSYKSKLSKLPEDDVDLIELENLRARIGFLRSRVDKLSNTAKSERMSLEQDFDQLHSQAPSEIVTKPNTNYTAKNPQRIESTISQNQVSNEELKSAPADANSGVEMSAGLEPKPKTRILTALERMEGHSPVPPSTEEPRMKPISKSADIEPAEPLAEAESNEESLEELAGEIIAMERALESRIADLLAEIVCRRRFAPSKDFSQLQDEREEMLSRINALQQVTLTRRQQIHFGHLSPDWAKGSGLYHGLAPEIKKTDAHKAIERIMFTRAESDSINRDLLIILDKYASLFKSPRFDFADTEEKYPGTDPRKDNYRGLESYDIQDMAQLVSFPESDKQETARQAAPGIVTEFARNLDERLSASIRKDRLGVSLSPQVVEKEEAACETAPDTSKESSEVDKSSLPARHDISRIQNIPLRKTLGKNITTDVGRGSVTFLNRLKDYERETRGASDASDPTAEELNKAMNAERAAFNAKITGDIQNAGSKDDIMNNTTLPSESSQDYTQSQVSAMYELQQREESMATKPEAQAAEKEEQYRDIVQASPKTTNNDLLGTVDPTRLGASRENNSFKQPNEPADIARCLYMMYTYDPEAKGVIREMMPTREQPEPNEKPLTLHQIMKRLEHPSRFIHELKAFSPQGPWQIVAAYPNTLVTRVMVPRNYERDNMRGKPLEDHFPLTQRQEQMATERDGHAGKVSREEGSRGNEGKRKGMGTFGRVVSTVIWGATVCYVAGVIGELLK